MKTFPFLGASALALSLVAAAPAWSAGYPERVVTIVVPYAPGGATDASARIVAQALAKQTGGNFIIENAPGAGTTIGAAEVARGGGLVLWDVRDWQPGGCAGTPRPARRSKYQAGC